MDPEQRRHIEVFGSLRVRGPGFEVERFPTRKVASLLGYLVVQPGPRHSKEVLIELLWPGRDFKQGRNSLRNALSSLRKLLRWRVEGPLRADKQGVTLAEGAVDSDLYHWRGSLQRALAASVAAEAADAFEAALALQRLPLLAESYDDWVLAERDAQRQTLRSCREAVGNALLAAGQAERVWALARDGCALDPLDERAACLALRACLQLGRFSAGLQQYRILLDALAEELDAEPCREAQRLAEALRSGGDAPEQEANAPLPDFAGRFLGRQDDLATLTLWLRERRQRVVTLTGVGGVGKSRLAAELARRLQRQGGAWVCWLALEGVERADRLPGLVRELVAAHTPASALGHARGLVVLDRIEALLPEAAEVLAGLLAQAPGLDLLASSRRPLQLPGERVWPVRPLELPAAGAALTALRSNPALQLLLARAQAVRPDLALNAANARDLTALCRRLDGHPQALEFAARQLGVFSPAQLVERCQQAPAPGDPLRGLLVSSLEGLPAAQRQTLAGLAVFRAGFAMAAAQTVLSDAGLPGVLESLRRHGLVLADSDQEPPRFSILAPLRRLLLEELAPARRQQLATRQLEAMLERSRQAEQTPEALQDELPDLRAALDTCLRAEPRIEPAVQLITNLGRFWLHCGHGAEGRRWIERTLAHGVADVYARGRLQHLHGVLSFAEGNLDDAAEVLRQAVHTLASQEREDELARALRHLAGVESLLGQVEQARARFERAEAIEVRRGDRFGIAHTREGLGWVHFRDADLAAACTQWAQAVEDYRRLDNGIRLAISLGSLGTALALRARHGQALLHLEESLAIFEARTLRNRAAFAREKLGCLWLRTDVEAAAEQFQHCLRLAQESERHLQILAHLGLARCERYRGAPDQAWQRLQRILPRARLDQERGACAEVFLTLADIANERGQTVRAAALYGSCLGTLRGLKHVGVLPACLEGLACLAGNAGREEAAARVWQQACALRRAWDVPRSPLAQQHRAPPVPERAEAEPAGDLAELLRGAGQLLSELEA